MTNHTKTILCVLVLAGIAVGVQAGDNLTGSAVTAPLVAGWMEKQTVNQPELIRIIAMLEEHDAS